MPMEAANMLDFIKKPEIIVFAGPNGSGKSTVTKYAKVIPPYINADDIKRATLCSDLEAAQNAEELRNKSLDEKKDFTFETVLSTRRNPKAVTMYLKKKSELVTIDVLN